MGVVTRTGRPQLRVDLGHNVHVYRAEIAFINMALDADKLELGCFLAHKLSTSESGIHRFKGDRNLIIMLILKKIAV